MQRTHARLTILALSALLPVAVPAAASAQVITKPTTVTAPTTTTPTLLVPALTITAPMLSGPVYAGVRTSVIVKVGNAKNGSTISVKPIPVAAPCTFVVPRATPVTTMTADGTTSVVVPGMFTHPATGLATTCAFSAEVTATKQDGTTTKTVVNSSTVPITASSVYVVQNTSDWIGKFAFANVTANGDCTGASNGPNGIFKVGLVTSEEGQALVDLTFKIRSGPTGTRCAWVSQPMLLPEGVRLTRIEFGVAASGPCSATPTAMTEFGGGFKSAENPALYGAAVVGTNPFGAGYEVSGLAPIVVNLQCGSTISNDRFATLFIKSLTFIGPPNLTGFP